MTMQEDHRSLTASSSLRQRLRQLEKQVAALTRTRQHFDAVFNHPHSFVGILDVKGRVLEANQAALDFIQAEQADVRGKPFWETPWWTHSPALQEKLQRHVRQAAQGSDAHFQAEHYAPDGRKMVVDFSLQPVRDDQGRVVSLLAVGRDITSLKESQEHLQTTQRRLENALETGRMAWWEMDVESGVVTFNEQKARMLGYDPAEFAGTRYTAWTDLLHPEDQPVARQAMHDHLEGKTPAYEVEYRIRTADGNWRWLYDRGAVTRRDAAGKPLTVTGIVIDVTERRQAEEELLRSRRQLSLMSSIAEIFLTESEEDMFADVLDVVRKALDSKYGYFGYINQQGDLVCPSMTRDVWEQCRIQGKDSVFPRRHWGGLWGTSLKEKKTLWANDGLTLPSGHIQLDNALVVPLLDHGNLVGQFVLANKPGGYTPPDARLVEHIAEYVAPILHAKLVEQHQREALEQSENKYRTLTENLNLGVYRSTPEGSFVEANPSMVSMFGYDHREEFLRQSVSDLYWRPADRHRFVEIMLTEGSVREWEVQLRRKDGTSFVGSVSAVAVKDEEGMVRYFDGIVADVTERKKMEEALAQLNEVLKLTNKIMRHDLLNDLNIMEGAIELFQEEPDRELLEKIARRIKKSVALIQRMRELESLVASGKELQVYDVRSVAEEVAADYDLPIRIEGRGRVLADSALPPVIDNIVRNAVLHGKTERIDITITEDEEGTELRIADYGRGIPDHIKERVFEERFSYGEEAGTGLGLYIVKKTVERYGGSVAIEDNQPQGAVFVLRLRSAHP